MTEQTDDTTEMDLPSSEQADQDVTTDQDTDQVDGAGSSDATDADRDTLSIVRDVVRDGEDGANPAQGSSPEGEIEDAGDPADTAADQPDNTDYSDVPFNKHPRFQQLLRQKKDAEVDAGHYRQITRFLDDNGLSNAEAAEALQLSALIRTDPVAAWTRMRPIVERVALAAGALIPPDLQQRVQAGEFSRDTALELSRARAGQSTAEARRQMEAQRQERQRQVQAQQDIVSAATTWSEERSRRDPNFAAKQDAIAREVAYLQATEGRPSDPAGVRAVLERAYAAVSANTPAPAPANPAPKRPVRPVQGGQVAAKPQAEPKSTLDIIRANRRTG